MSQSRNVLCVLLDDHRKDYEPEFARLRQTGANFVFESDPEKSLSMVRDIDPNLVIVGMDVGSMEGIEFLALLTSQYPGFSGSVVVLPGKADGMPPVIHSRTHSSGRSAVEGVNFDHIAALIAEPQPQPDSPPPPAPQAVPKTETVPGVSQPSSPFEGDPIAETLPERPGRAKWPIPVAVAGGVLVFAVLGYFLFAGGGEAKQDPEGTPDSKMASVVPAKEPAQEPDDGEKEPVAPPDPSVAEPDPPIQPPVAGHSDLPEKFVLPLSFDEGMGRPEVADGDGLDNIVSALKQQPGVKIELTGHTSALGEVANNFKLGMLRARMTKRLLVRRGISPRQVKLRSRGEKEPIDSSPAGRTHPSNRRVEVRIIH